MLTAERSLTVRCLQTAYGLGDVTALVSCDRSEPFIPIRVGIYLAMDRRTGVVPQHTPLGEAVEKHVGSKSLPGGGFVDIKLRAES